MMLKLSRFSIWQLFPVLLLLLCPCNIAAKSWFTEQEMTDLYEALVTLYSEGIYAPDSKKADGLLENYVETLDPYGKYLNPSQYKAYRASLRSDYIGVQMDIEADGEGNILLMPFYGGQAAKAGIVTGDRLLAVDGRNVEDREIYEVGSTIRGILGSSVELLIERKDGSQKIFVIKRSKSSYKSVTVGQLGPWPTIKIHRFTDKTPLELQKFLTPYTKHTVPLLIDLRNNSGGDMQAGIDAAELFLEEGKRIVTVKGRTSEQLFVSQNEKPYLISQLILLQNRETASSAELFIAALAHNNLATTVGYRSKGKGVAQKFYELSSGGALLLSYAKLFPPDRISYHEKGLKPDIELQKVIAGDSDTTYLRAVNRIVD